MPEGLDAIDGAFGGGDRPADVGTSRRRAATAGHLSDEITARALLADDAGIVRATALGALARCGRLRRSDLVTALTDSDPNVRRRAVTLIAGAEPAGEVDRPPVSLLDLLADPEPTVVETTAWACGERTPTEPGAVSRLATLATGHDDPLVREAAVAALGAIGDPAGVHAVLAATGDRATVRRRAVLALAPFSGPEVDAALARARTDRDWQVRQAAEDLT